MPDYEFASTCSTLVQWKTTSLAISLKCNFYSFIFSNIFTVDNLKVQQMDWWIVFVGKNLKSRISNEKQQTELNAIWFNCMFLWMETRSKDRWFQIKDNLIEGYIWTESCPFKASWNWITQRKPLNVITTDNVIKLKEIFRSQLSY